MIELLAPHLPHPALGTVACSEPGCPAAAAVVARLVLSSTDGPVSRMRTRCPHGHVRTPLASTAEEIQ